MKIKTKNILAPLLIFLIFFIGFVVGISLIIHGYNLDKDVELMFGVGYSLFRLISDFSKI